ncbi:hypothetical protein ACTA71_000264 [Dictyostelium dimigraforme]
MNQRKLAKCKSDIGVLKPIDQLNIFGHFKKHLTTGLNSLKLSNTFGNDVKESILSYKEIEKLIADAWQRSDTEIRSEDFGNAEALFLIIGIMLAMDKININTGNNSTWVIESLSTSATIKAVGLIGARFLANNNRNVQQTTTYVLRGIRQEFKKAKFPYQAPNQVDSDLRPQFHMNTELKGALPTLSIIQSLTSGKNKSNIVWMNALEIK